MMKTLSLQSSHQVALPRPTMCKSSNSRRPSLTPFMIPCPTPSPIITHRSHSPPKPHPTLNLNPKKTTQAPQSDLFQDSPDECSRRLILGAVSLGFLLVLMGLEDHHKALALGPEGPLVEEFWENVRRYALYALTVSTGAIYTVVQPVLELLKNPISAVLILVILGGGVYIVYQVVAAMVGVTQFSYDYAY